MNKLVPIIMGSESDFDFAAKIIPGIEKFGIEYDLRVASAHKHPTYLLAMLNEYDTMLNASIVYVAVAGRQHALAPTMAANTTNVVIASYPDAKSDADIISSLHMPRGVTIYPVLDPENVGITVAKLMRDTDPDQKTRIQKYLDGLKSSIEDADARMRQPGIEFYEDIREKLEEGAGGNPVSGVVIEGKYATLYFNYHRKMLSRIADEIIPMPSADDASKIQQLLAQKKKIVVINSTENKSYKWPDEFYRYNLDQGAGKIRE